jgi:hypothetical protein
MRRVTKALLLSSAVTAGVVGTAVHPFAGHRRRDDPTRVAIRSLTEAGSRYYR